MTRVLTLLIVAVMFNYITCPPVTPAPKAPPKAEEEESDDKEDLVSSSTKYIRIISYTVYTYTIESAKLK